jgi:hypothetical protein
VGLRDLRRPGAAPLTLRDLRVTNAAPLVLEGAHPEDSPPLQLEARGTLAPVASACAINLLLRPLAAQRRLGLDLRLEGLSGEGLLQAFPELDRLEPDGIEGGSLAVDLEVRELPRPASAPGLGVALTAEDVELRAGDRTRLFGLEHASLQVESYDPETGALEASSLEVTRPFVALERRRSGMRAFGFRVPEEELQVEERVSAPDEAVGPEVRCERIDVSGGRLALRDARTQDPVELPLIEVDLELRGWSSWLRSAPRPLKVHLEAQADPVPLPWPPSKGLPEPKPGQREGLDQRRALLDLDLRANVSLVPHRRGTVELELVGFELSNLRGPARGRGVNLRHGLLSAQAKARLRAPETTLLDATLVFDQLDLSEPADGPVKQALGLEVPLHVVLAALRDGDGKHEVEVEGLELDPETQLLSQGARGALIRAVGGVVQRAFVSLPKRTAKTLGEGALRLLPEVVRKRLEPAEETKLEPIGVAFSPGDAFLSARERAKLEPLIDHLRSSPDGRLRVTLDHELSGEDRALVEERVSPSTEELNGLLTQLRRHLRDGALERSELAARAERALEAGDREGFLRTARLLAALDVELGRTERARDRVFDRLESASRWDTKREVRAGAVELGQARLEAVRRALVEAGVPNVAGRIRVRKPSAQAVERAGPPRVSVIPRLQ